MNLRDLIHSLALDEAFHGQYELLGILGEGGMGVVVRAHQRSLDRAVAIKFLRSEVTSFDEQALQRFVDEARLTASLHHRNVVEVYAVDRCGDTGYIVYEYVEGKSLRARLDEKKRLSPIESFRIVQQAALGLAHAHEQGVVHRDVKPDNLLITPAGVVKVADFGLAKHDSSKTLRTQRGIIMGTPEYLSPERIDGKRAEGASDVYALGVVLYECLTGQPPFLGPSMDVLISHLRKPVPPVHSSHVGLPPEAEDLVARCMEKKPERRGSAARLAEDVSRLLVSLQRQRASGPLEPLPKGRLLRSRSSVHVQRSHATRNTRDFEEDENTGLHDPVVEEAIRNRRHRRIATAAGAIAAIVLLLLYLFWPRPFAYRDLNIELQAGRGIVRFRSLRPFPTVVEGDGKGIAMAVDRRDQAVREHRVEITGLEAGKQYRFHLRYPDGRSSDPIFLSMTRPLRNFRLDFPRGNHVLATWQTPKPALCHGEIRHGARGSWSGVPTKGKDEAAREHRLELDIPLDGEAPYLRIVVKDGIVTWIDEARSLRFDSVFAERVERSDAWQSVEALFQGRRFRDPREKALSLKEDAWKSLMADVEGRQAWCRGFLGDENRLVADRLRLFQGLQRLRLFEAYVPDARRPAFRNLEEIHAPFCALRVLDEATVRSRCQPRNLLQFFPPSSFFVPLNIARKVIDKLDDGATRLVAGARHMKPAETRVPLRPLRPDTREVELVFRLSLFLEGSFLRLSFGQDCQVWLVPRKAFSVEQALTAFRESGAFMRTPTDIEENFPPEYWSVTLPASAIGRNGSSLQIDSLAAVPGFFRLVSIRSVHMLEH